MEATDLEGSATLWAGRWRTGGLVAPVGDRAFQREVFEHARPHASEAGIEFSFELAQGGFGMLEAPVGDAGHDLSAQLMPVLLEAVPFHVPSSDCSSGGVVPKIVPDLVVSYL